MRGSSSLESEAVKDEEKRSDKKCDVVFLVLCSRSRAINSNAHLSFTSGVISAGFTALLTSESLRELVIKIQST